MLLLILVCAGVGLVTISILIEKFNNGKCSAINGWLAGVYLGAAANYLTQGEYLIAVLCLIPTVALVLPNLIRRCEGVVSV